MDILAVNADQKLFNMASCIGRSPVSWQGWQALHIKVDEIAPNLHQDFLLWTKSIVESYLRGAEGRVYFREDGDIFVICKNMSAQIMHEAGTQICDLVYREISSPATCHLYDLGDSGFEFSMLIVEDSDLLQLDNEPHNEDHNSLFFGKTDEDDKHAHDSSLIRQPRVLLVEDDPVTRWMVRNTLKDECSFACAPDAGKAYTMFSSFQPDIVFLDIGLPDNDGYEVLKWIMRNDPGAYVVMFSGNDNIDNIATALEEGASGFVAKPFTSDSLLRYIGGLGTVNMAPV